MVASPAATRRMTEVALISPILDQQKISRLRENLELLQRKIIKLVWLISANALEGSAVKNQYQAISSIMMSQNSNYDSRSKVGYGRDHKMMASISDIDFLHREPTVDDDILNNEWEQILNDVGPNDPRQVFYFPTIDKLT